MSSVLYISSACQHSMALLNDIHSAGIANRFTFFDVSKQRGRPKYVDRVPMLIHEGRMYVDDDLFALFAPPVPDIHDPRVRLQQTASPSGASPSGASTSAGDYGELAAYNEGVGALDGLCGHDALGLIDMDSSPLDMNAPVELMDLQECEPLPSGKNGGAPLEPPPR